MNFDCPPAPREFLPRMSYYRYPYDFHLPNPSFCYTDHIVSGTFVFCLNCKFENYGCQFVGSEFSKLFIDEYALAEEHMNKHNHEMVCIKDAPYDDGVRKNLADSIRRSHKKKVSKRRAEKNVRNLIF